MKKLRNHVSLLASSLSVFALCSIAEGVPFDVSGWGTKTGAKATTAQRQPSRTTTYTVQSTPKIVIE